MNMKSSVDKIRAMEEGGIVLSSILKELLDISVPGISLLEIEALAQADKRSRNDAVVFTVADYKWATCLCVNEVIVHGIPSKYQVKRRTYSPSTSD